MKKETYQNYDKGIAPWDHYTKIQKPLQVYSLRKDKAALRPFFSSRLSLVNVQDQETDTSLLGESSSSVDDLDLPIALRKGNVLVTHQSPSHSELCLILVYYPHLNHLCCKYLQNCMPSNVSKALKYPEWKATMTEDMHALAQNKT